MRRSCCSHRVSGRHSMARYGACDLSGPLQQLSDALEQANALGLYNNVEVIDAQAVYNSYLAMSLDCAGIAEATPAVADWTARVRALVAKNTPAGGFTVGPLPSLPSQVATPMAMIGLGFVGAWVAWWAVTK